MSKTFRIATWNFAAARTMLKPERLAYNEGEDLEYIANELKKLAPDVVCLQESHTNKHDSLAKRLAAKAGYAHVIDAPNCPSHIDSAYRLSNAIVSHKSLTRTRIVDLPMATFPLIYKGKTVTPYERVAVFAEVSGITVGTMHTEPLEDFGQSYTFGEGAKLAGQIDKVLAPLLRNPFVFAGDWNTGDVQTAHKLLLDVMDAKEVMLGDTRPFGVQSDHIITSRSLVVADLGVVKTNTDHFLCWVDIELPS